MAKAQGCFRRFQKYNCRLKNSNQDSFSLPNVTKVFLKSTAFSKFLGSRIGGAIVFVKRELGLGYAIVVEFNIQKVDNENRFNECAGGISYEVAPYAKEMHEYYEWCEWARGLQQQDTRSRLRGLYNAPRTTAIKHCLLIAAATPLRNVASSFCRATSG